MAGDSDGRWVAALQTKKNVFSILFLTEFHWTEYISEIAMDASLSPFGDGAIGQSPEYKDSGIQIQSFSRPRPTDSLNQHRISATHHLIRSPFVVSVSGTPPPRPAKSYARTKVQKKSLQKQRVIKYYEWLTFSCTFRIGIAVIFFSPFAFKMKTNRKSFLFHFAILSFLQLAPSSLAQSFVSGVEKPSLELHGNEEERKKKNSNT